MGSAQQQQAAPSVAFFVASCMHFSRFSTHGPPQLLSAGIYAAARKILHRVTSRRKSIESGRSRRPSREESLFLRKLYCGRARLSRRCVVDWGQGANLSVAFMSQLHHHVGPSYNSGGSTDISSCLVEHRLRRSALTLGKAKRGPRLLLLRAHGLGSTAAGRPFGRFFRR